jgi:hypothetical protein
VICLAPRAREDSVRPRRLGDASVRPLNFTVRGQPNHRPYSRMVLVPYVSYTFGCEPKLRVGPGQGRAEPA